MKNRSISIELKRKKTHLAQQRLLSKWVVNWQNDQLNVIKKIELAARNNDISEVFHMLDQLRGISDKRFSALNNIFNIVTDPERQLIDDRINENVEGARDVPKETADIDDIVYTLDRKPNIDIKNLELDIDEIVKCYNSGMSLNEISDWNNISVYKLRKILVSIGVFTSDTYDKIKDMRAEGKSDWEIMDRLDISKNALNSYTPYKKGLYNLQNPSENAKKIRKSRANRKVTNKI